MREGHQRLDKAITELRRRLDWGQAELAAQINMRRGRSGLSLASTRHMVSQWENGEHLPSPIYRGALAEIAARHKGTKDLASAFRGRPARPHANIQTKGNPLI
jgi:transcriptional regulator with XRE-family HTH domain